MRTTTTQAEFARFRREVRRMLEKLGMKGWRVVVLREALDGCYGDMHADHVGRVATIRYNAVRDSVADVADDVDDPERVARHEVLELFLARMEWIAMNRWGSGQELAEEKHHVIRVLEGLL